MTVVHDKIKKKTTERRVAKESTGAHCSYFSLEEKESWRSFIDLLFKLQSDCEV